MLDLRINLKTPTPPYLASTIAPDQLQRILNITHEWKHTLNPILPKPPQSIPFRPDLMLRIEAEASPLSGAPHDPNDYSLYLELWYAPQKLWALRIPTISANQLFPVIEAQLQQWTTTFNVALFWHQTATQLLQCYAPLFRCPDTTEEPHLDWYWFENTELILQIKTAQGPTHRVGLLHCCAQHATTNNYGPQGHWCYTAGHSTPALFGTEPNVWSAIPFQLSDPKNQDDCVRHLHNQLNSAMLAMVQC